MSEEITYKDAGVDIDEGARAVHAIHDAVKSTYRPEVIGDIGGFGGLFSVAALKGMEDPLLVSGTDGVGTKLALAQMAGKHDTVGIDLVAMCVNDILACGAEPLFFLDYIAIGKLKSEQVAQIVGGIAEGCKQAGCALVGGEMAEHPGVMDPDDYDLSGFAVGAVDRPKMLDPEHVQEGDVVLGLASSGIHSNGYSLVRRAVTEKMTMEELQAPNDELDDMSVLDALLVPTRIYVKSILALLKTGIDVHAVAHITGGGISENLNRALPANVNALLDYGSWDCPAIIKYVVNAAGLSLPEALRTFNMGLGMCVIVPADQADAAAEQLRSTGETVWKVGAIVAGNGEVSYENLS